MTGLKEASIFYGWLANSDMSTLKQVNQGFLRQEFVPCPQSLNGQIKSSHVP